MSLFTSFNSGVSGIVNAQAGLNTTAHNVANTKTPGYSRQQNINSDTYYNNIKVTEHDTLQVGYGVTITDVRQIRDMFLDSKYRVEVGRKAFYEVQLTTEQEVEDILGEMEGVEFHEALEKMWDTIQSMSTDPAAITKRELLIAEAGAFLRKAQEVYQSLRDYQVNLNAQIMSKVSDINKIADKIVEMNHLISKSESSGIENANDYRDQRNLLMDELAEYTAYDAYEDANGNVLIRVNNAPLVDEQRAYYMACERIPGSSMYTVKWDGAGHREVYNVDRAFSKENDSDVGSLLSVLIARGTKFGYYTDIPQDIQERRAASPNAQDWQDDLRNYNNTVGNCLLERVEAQFDLLIHKVVTAINDAFCPNISADLSTSGIAGLPQNAKVLDARRCPVGTDDDETPGTELFSRKNGERYTVYTVTGPVYAVDENGNQLLDEDGNPIDVTRVVNGVRQLYVYNEEDPSDVDTMYTLQNLEMNNKVLGNYNYLPVRHNPEEGREGEYDWDIYADMLAGWRKKDIVLDPNAMTAYGADEYYDNLVNNIGVLGSVWNSMVDAQTSQVESIEDKRQQISGVSTEEEMVSMLMYQHAYNASSRYITVIDEMLEHLIERLG